MDEEKHTMLILTKRKYREYMNCKQRRHQSEKKKSYQVKKKAIS